VAASGEVTAGRAQQHGEYVFVVRELAQHCGHLPMQDHVEAIEQLRSVESNLRHSFLDIELKCMPLGHCRSHSAGEVGSYSSARGWHCPVALQRSGGDNAPVDSNGTSHAVHS